MNNTIIEEFKRISFLCWIPSVNKGTGSVGLTFENELYKNPDSLFFPDYNGFEIKCSTRYSRFPHSLFSIAFDGPSFPEINRLIDLYGYNDYMFTGKKVLKVDIDALNTNKGGNYKFKFKVDRNENKLYLEIYDLNDNFIERKSFVYLDNLISRLQLKLSNLVIINASKKKIANKEFFRYYELKLYELRDNDLFIKLLEEGKIIATLESRIGKSGDFYGKYKNKNLVFKIKREYLEELFTKKYCLNTDKENL